MIKLSKATFFSNTLIYLDLAENETQSSLANTRPNNQLIFSVPEHNVNTDNLLIFVDGRVKIRGEHYEDINSFQVRFFSELTPNQEFHSVLIKNPISSGIVEGVYWEDF